MNEKKGPMEYDKSKHSYKYKFKYTVLHKTDTKH